MNALFPRPSSLDNHSIINQQHLVGVVLVVTYSQVSFSRLQLRFWFGRTQVVVVVLGVTNADKEDNEVDDGYRAQLAWCRGLMFEMLGFVVRLTEGSLPKCLAWYRPRRPLGATSGATPRGSFS